MMKLLLALLGLLSVGTFGQNTCDDAYECDSDTLTYTYVYCYGYYGCDDADITSTITYATGALGANSATIETSTLYAWGYRGAYYAKILGITIQGYGYQSLYYADLEPKTTAITIYAYGYYAAYVADIYCYSGDTCKIYCGGSSGCLSSKFYCYSQATCYYDCSTDEICPTLYSGIGSQVIFEGNVKGEHFEGMTDDEIKAKKIENTHIKRKMIANKENEGPFEGEDEAAYKARMDIDAMNNDNLLAIDGHLPQTNIINGAKLSYGHKMVIGGAAISVAFIVGALFGKYKGNQYDKI